MPRAVKRANAPAYYALFADLRGRRCILIGGGKVAHQKARQLLEAGAEVVCVSPELCAPLRRFADARAIEHRKRAFRAADLTGAWLAVAATDDAAVNRKVYAASERRRILCNVVDQPELCSFIVPAVVRRPPLQVAISTGGASPYLAGHLKDVIGGALGEDYPRMARLLRGLRDEVRRALPGVAGRKRYYASLLDGEVFRLAKKGKMREARALAREQLAAASVGDGMPPAKR